MQANWFSRQGNERARNSDVAAVGQRGQYVLAVLVDGAEKGPLGAELAQHWADIVFQTLIETATCSTTSLFARLKQEHAQLRPAFLRDIASYCMVSLDLTTLEVQVWHCGDCRVGLRLQAEIQWLTTPHVLAHQPGLPAPNSSREQERHRQQLTRCLNVKRFIPPECSTFTLEQGQALLLSSDGYWQEHLESGTLLHCLRDDASLLVLPTSSRQLGQITQSADTNNLRYYAVQA